MGDFAESIRGQAGKVAAATESVLEVAQGGLSAQLMATGRVSVSRSNDDGYSDVLSAIVGLLDKIAEKDSNTYLDGERVSASLASRSRIALAGRGIR